MIEKIKNKIATYKCTCSKCGKTEIIQAVNPILTDNCFDCMLKELKERRKLKRREKK